LNPFAVLDQRGWYESQIEPDGERPENPATENADVEDHIEQKKTVDPEEVGLDPFEQGKPAIFYRLPFEQGKSPAIGHQNEIAERIFGKCVDDLSYVLSGLHRLDHHVFGDSLDVDRQDDSRAAEAAPRRLKLRSRIEFTDGPVPGLAVKN